MFCDYGKPNNQSLSKYVCHLFLKHTHTHTHTLTHTLALSLSLTHTHSLSHYFTYYLSFPYSPFHSISFSLLNAIHALSPLCYPPLFLFPSLFFLFPSLSVLNTHALYMTIPLCLLCHLFLKRTNTHTYTYTHSHNHTHTLSLSHSFTYYLSFPY
jgi:hypothetical protein